MPKEDCKYWDKCYQKNEYHLSKYNHPKNVPVDVAGGSTAESNSNKDASHAKMESKDTSTECLNKKRKTSDDAVKDVVAENVTADKDNDKYETRDLRTEALNNIAGKNYMEILEKRIKFSVEKEYEELLRSTEFIRHKFLVEMPPDFYAFWNFVQELKKNATGEEILQYMEKQFQIQLVGPFEFLAGRFKNAKIQEPGDYLRHWRFFYDPPEFQTIFVRSKTGVHYGYWRDTPKDKKELLIARNDARENCEFQFIAGNAFDAFLYFLQKDFVGTPFTAATVANTKKMLTAFTSELDCKLEKLETLSNARQKKVVTKSFHRAGIVVPFDHKTKLGYRPLMTSNAELKKILQLFVTAGQPENDKDIKSVVMEKLQPLANAALIAVDECDFGTALELGIDLFCSGRSELHLLAKSLLVPAYSNLDRPQFIAIAKAHMEERSKNLNLSMFD
ncbi:histone PARylation factor 1-like [Teleopsis dalmanni]|uniref:histone PARylation factor 1-like n=1 Tax=Teleopsis dalmanni TaxID=139649 RepID=UPI0018CE16FE|nr:histone PARylation factor 1-like [Teleopsis dalmanni]